MNEKICPSCGRQNPPEMSFCLNCGNSLATGNAQNYPPDSAPTVFVSPNVQQNAQPGFQPSFQPLTPNLPPQPKKSRTGFYLAVFGGIGLILILIFGGIAGMVAMNWDKITGKGEDNKNSKRVVNANVDTPTPTPKRSNRNNSSDNTASNLTPSFTPTPSSDTDNQSSTGASARFDDLWVDYNVKENGQLGMRIHVKFTVNNLKGVDSYLAIYFETRDGVRLKDKSQRLYSQDGAVAVYRSLKPGYDVTEYDDLTVFMPYDELDLGRGKYELRMDADVIYKEGGLVQHLTYHDFDYSE